MSLIVLGYGWAGALTSAIAVALLGALGFRFGWGGYQVALWVGMPACVVQAGRR